MKINKSTLFLWGTVGLLTVAIAIVMIFGKEEKPSKVTQANQTTTSQQQATHQEKPSTQQPQQKQQDPNTKDLEVGGTKIDGITSNENEDIEQVKKVASEFFHLFDEKNVMGLEAEKYRNDLNQKIQSVFTKEAIKKYSVQDIAKHYENLGLYSFIGKGEQSMMDLKLKEIQIKNVVFSKEYQAYMMGIQVTTKQNKMIIGVGLQKEENTFKFMHVPDSKVVQIK
ncbi:hypothetical protein P9C03_25320 [Bacillus mycoides]|uniref:hypothetical protein n=1 Tax=Bacillus mycoides TaxID=1405 RepID=UPI002E0199E3|nr:hypothetical protein [Bacillus mycoides]